MSNTNERALLTTGPDGDKATTYRTVTSILRIVVLIATVLSKEATDLKGQANKLNQLRGHMSITNDRALLTTGPDCGNGTTYRTAIARTTLSLRIIILNTKFEGNVVNFQAAGGGCNLQCCLRVDRLHLSLGSKGLLAPELARGYVDA